MIFNNVNHKQTGIICCLECLDDDAFCKSQMIERNDLKKKLLESVEREQFLKCDLQKKIHIERKKAIEKVLYEHKELEKKLEYIFKSRKEKLSTLQNFDMSIRIFDTKLKEITKAKVEIDLNEHGIQMIDENSKTMNIPFVDEDQVLKKRYHMDEDNSSDFVSIKKKNFQKEEFEKSLDIFVKYFYMSKCEFINNSLNWNVEAIFIHFDSKTEMGYAFKCLDSEEGIKLSELLKKYPFAVGARFYCCDLTPNWIEDIFAALALSQCLSELVIRRCNVPQEIEFIEELLSKSKLTFFILYAIKRATKIEAIINGLRNSSHTLKELYLMDCKLIIQDCRRIGEFLKTCTALKRFYCLANKRIGKGEKYLYEGLKHFKGQLDACEINNSKDENFFLEWIEPKKPLSLNS